MQLDKTKLATAKALISACELDLQRKLNEGEKRDLLMDNTKWQYLEIKDIVVYLIMQENSCI